MSEKNKKYIPATMNPTMNNPIHSIATPDLENMLPQDSDPVRNIYG